MSFEAGYCGVDTEGVEYVIVDITPEYYIIERADGTTESVIRTD